MFHLPLYLRSAIVWAMVPGALWSGIQAPECVCASGEHRFFCPKMFGRGCSKPVAVGEAVSQTGTKHACCSQKSARPISAACCAAKSNGPAPAGVDSASSGPCDECKAVPSSFAYVTDGIQVSASDWTAFSSPVFSADEASLVARQGDDHRIPASDRLPMTDRVIVLCCLLI